MLPSHQTNLEILPIVIHLSNISFCITVFYRPPDTSSYIFDSLFSFLASLYIHQFSNFVLIDDFNVNMKNPSHPLYHKVCSLMDFFSLNQVVTDYTHTSPCGNTSLIDLALTSSPAQTVTCDSIPPLANSDHNGLNLNVSLKSNLQYARTNRRTVCSCGFFKSQ